MMYDDLTMIAGAKVDPAMYPQIEEIYMAYNELTKHEMVAMYFGYKKGAYGLYRALVALNTESYYLTPMITHLRLAGLTDRADELEQDMINRKAKVIAKVKAMKLNECKEFKRANVA